MKFEKPYKYPKKSKKITKNEQIFSSFFSEILNQNLTNFGKTRVGCDNFEDGKGCENDWKFDEICMKSWLFCKKI